MKFLAWLCLVGAVWGGNVYGRQNDADPRDDTSSDRDVAIVLQALDRERREILRFAGLSSVAGLGAVGLYSTAYATRGDGVLALTALGLLAGDLVLANRAVAATQDYINLVRLVDPGLDTRPLSRSAQTVRASFTLLGGGVGVALGGLVVASFPALWSLVDGENREQLARTAGYILIGGAVAGGSMVAISFPLRIGGTMAMRRRVRSLHEEAYAAVDRASGHN